jgi:hypothetical protein
MADVYASYIVTDELCKSALASARLRRNGGRTERCIWREVMGGLAPSIHAYGERSRVMPANTTDSDTLGHLHTSAYACIFILIYIYV